MNIDVLLVRSIRPYCIVLSLTKIKSVKYSWISRRISCEETVLSFQSIEQEEILLICFSFRERFYLIKFLQVSYFPVEVDRLFTQIVKNI